jgi:hypothetical protein
MPRVWLSLALLKERLKAQPSAVSFHHSENIVLMAKGDSNERV